MNTKKIMLIIMVICGLSLFSYSKNTDLNEKPIKIGWCLWTGWYPLAIAQEMNFFTRNGVKN